MPRKRKTKETPKMEEEEKTEDVSSEEDTE